MIFFKKKSLAKTVNSNTETMKKPFGFHTTISVHPFVYANKLDAADIPNYKFISILKTFHTIAYYLCIYPFKFSIDEEGNIQLHESIIQKVIIPTQIAFQNVYIIVNLNKLTTLFLQFRKISCYSSSNVYSV